MDPALIPYGHAVRRRRKWRVVAISLVAYIAAYVALRASGRIYPYYSQGSYEMELQDTPELTFLPVMMVESVWHNAFSPPPAGG